MEFTVNYWMDDGWYVGMVKEIPGVFSQGETLEELLENLQDAYKLVMEESASIPHGDIQTTNIHLHT